MRCSWQQGYDSRFVNLPEHSAEEKVVFVDFDHQLLQIRQQVEERLEELLCLSSHSPDRLTEAMKYSLLDAGKRLRPALCVWGAEACGVSGPEVLTAACAVEMVHTYSLIHDDLPAMDDDDLRRGKPTSHKQFDEATAILAGDALLTYAFEVLASHIADSGHAIQCVSVLANAAGPEGMVGGQMADLLAETIPVQTRDELEAIHHRKTGRLFACSLQMGGVLANAGKPELEALANYGFHLGLAFQVTDDLLDETGSSEKLGKGVRKDRQRGKLTYPSLLGLEASQQIARDCVSRACDSIAVFGDRGRCLDALARYVLERDH